MKNGCPDRIYYAILLMLLAVSSNEALASHRPQLTRLLATNSTIQINKDKLIKNIRYRAEYPLCIGDIYSPDFGGKHLPAVIVVHGGAWRAGKKEDYDATAASITLVQNNFVVFNINYRLTPDGGEFPNNIEDVKHAISYLRKNATRYSVDDRRIGVFGTSAGGHLALMAAYAPNPNFGIKEKNPIKAVVAFCPLTDLQQMEVAFAVQYIGCMVDQCKDVWEKASPISYVQTSVPTLLVHGYKDKTVPFQQSALLEELLKLHHTKAEMLALPNSDHLFSTTNGEDRLKSSNAMVNFFKENL